MNLPSNPYVRKTMILGVIIVVVGGLALFGLTRVVGKEILILIIIMAVVVVASKTNNKVEDKSQPKHIESTRSDSGVGRAFSKWWHS